MYWDIGYRPEALSYRRAMNEAGIATVAVDRLGSGRSTATIEAATYRDVDGVVITGMTHHVNVPGAVPVFTTLIPAAPDPKLASHGLDLGYLTTTAGSRYGSFHTPGDTEPGGGDANFCGPPLGADCSSNEALRTSEAPFYAPEARLRAYVVPEYGHSLNFSPQARGYHRSVIDWTTGIG